ncbi:Peptidase E [Arenibacter antarcticus]|uniref:Dipeptidase PepE n=1 Tax=Arenibacter antarcticus TaxID=2040469 RepID=A0ABW5VIX9_9FLAO|nr:dipeptidase PepE [Arenibacter sp. H213]MCM4169623.1 dipeptidase PepE [Arenibacter sp. H213]
MKKLLLASTSTLFGQSYLEYLLTELTTFFSHTDTVTFIPYARPGGISHDNYTELVAMAFSKIDKKVVGLHTYQNPLVGIAKADALYTGGGNTFLLVQQLHRLELMQPLKQKIGSGTPYFGTSAGSNIAGPSMKTTNDMPIVYPSSFDTLGVVDFNLNPHYLDPDPNSTHKGETRETRIREFHSVDPTPVVGLREGNYILINGKQTTLKGSGTARIFEAGKTPFESLQIPF